MVVALVAAVVAVPVLAIVLLGTSAEDREPQFRSVDRDEPASVFDTDEQETIFQIEVGDCLLEPTGEEITSFTNQPCHLSHDMEVFHITEHPGGRDAPYPGEAALIDYAQEVCVEAFPDFVGLPWLDSTLDTYYLYPVDRGWRILGDREIVCTIYDPAGPVEGTLEGAAR